MSDSKAAGKFLVFHATPSILLQGFFLKPARVLPQEPDTRRRELMLPVILRGAQARSHKNQQGAFVAPPGLDPGPTSSPVLCPG